MNLAKLKRKAAFNSYSLGAFDWASKRAGKKPTEERSVICQHRKNIQGAEIRWRVGREIRFKANSHNKDSLLQLR